MSPKNATIILFSAFSLLTGIVVIGLWWFTNPSNANLGALGDHPSPAVEPSDIKSFAQVQIPSGSFNYGGSTTWAPVRGEVDPAIQTTWPQFHLTYTNPTSGVPGSGTGIKMLLNNQLAFAQSSRSLKDAEYQQARQQGFTLKQIPVAIDAIAFAVNPKLNIPGLTVAQLKDIYTGKLTNWNQVGGPNLPIVPYSRHPEDSGTVAFFMENGLEGQKFGANVQLIPTTTQALRQVSENLGGIYYASATEIIPQCKVKPLPLGRKADELVPPYKEPSILPSQCPRSRNQLNATAFQSDKYPITRQLFVIIKQNNQPDQQAGEAYANLLLTSQGQDLIAKAGFIKANAH